MTIRDLQAAPILTLAFADLDSHRIIRTATGIAELQKLFS